jgi:hypothetical protein
MVSFVVCVLTYVKSHIASVRGNESGAASGREHGGAARKNSICWGLPFAKFESYCPLGVFSLAAIPCRMHRISFDRRRSRASPEVERDVDEQKLTAP